MRQEIRPIGKRQSIDGHDGGEGDCDEGNVKTVVREAATKEITEEKNKGYVVIKYVHTNQLGNRIAVSGGDI